MAVRTRKLDEIYYQNKLEYYQQIKRKIFEDLGVNNASTQHQTLIRWLKKSGMDSIMF